MSSNEARQIIAAGLDRRKEERVRRDAALEDQARQLRLTINDNHNFRTMSEIQRKALEKENAQKRRAERAKAKADMVARDRKAEKAIQKYGIVCLLILLLTAISRMNVFCSLALALGLAVFPAVYIYRLYVPLEELPEK